MRPTTRTDGASRPPSPAPPPSPPSSPPPADETPPLLLTARSGLTDPQLTQSIGGKALNLFRLSEILQSAGAAADAPLPGGVRAARVPPFFAVTTAAFGAFLEHNDLLPAIRLPPHADLAAHAERVHDLVVAAQMPPAVEAAVSAAYAAMFAGDEWVAVRSSGTDEDSSENSFAGQYESFLFQRGAPMVLEALKRCWASAFSERVFASRLRARLAPEASRMGVVVQKMVRSDVSGVAFSRHPLSPASSAAALVSAVLGVGEGLVSGALDSDAYLVPRAALRAIAAGGGEEAVAAAAVTKELAEKTERFVFDVGAGRGLVSEAVPPALHKAPCLRDVEAISVALMALRVEDVLGCPQDTEWALEAGSLFVVQARPVPTLPNAAFFERHVDPKRDATLWDNSNIVESYSGVTTPLTFSWASVAYYKAYLCTFKNNGVPDAVVRSHDGFLRNLLGLQRGHVYYNLMNWYRALGAVPLPEAMRDKLMDQMMGVKAGLTPELEALIGSARTSVPAYGGGARVGLLKRLVANWLYTDEVVREFVEYFEAWYDYWRRRDFYAMSLHELVGFYHETLRHIIDEWDVPPANDTLLMVFFGMAKKLTAELPGMEGDEGAADELLNNLLTGQDVRSFQPTAHLMRIAAIISDGNAATRDWFVQTGSEEIARVVQAAAQPPAHTRQVVAELRSWVDQWGFRCANELKLEENDFADDPRFLVDQLQGYLKSGKFRIEEIHEREERILREAEAKLQTHLSRASLVTRLKYRWVLKNARRHVAHRENLRFLRTQLWGVLRKLFRGMGHQLAQLGYIDAKMDVFYLTVDEIVAFVEGRGVSGDLRPLIEVRQREFESYRQSAEPPERFLTFGAHGAYARYPLLTADLDLLKDENAAVSDDPNTLVGTACCPGVVETHVRVVASIKECAGMSGEILVTARTDPGWITVYPMCGGLLIERGSLLSHSAVVAREVGLPTIVSISGGLTKRLKTGMKVRMDGGKGTVTILTDEHGAPVEAPPSPPPKEPRDAVVEADSVAVTVGGKDELRSTLLTPADTPPPPRSRRGGVCLAVALLLASPLLLVGLPLALFFVSTFRCCLFSRPLPKRWKPRPASEPPFVDPEGALMLEAIDAPPPAKPEGAAPPPERQPHAEATPDSVGAFYTFFMERVPVLVYALLCGGMVLSGVYISTGKFDLKAFLIAFGVGMLFLVLLRFMDEVKDVDKDKKGHPERPLPRGLLSVDAVTRGIHLMYTALLAASIGCFWLTIASGVCGLIVSLILWLMYVEFYCPALLDRSPLLVAVTHQSIIFPLAVFTCCAANGDGYKEGNTYFLGMVLLGSMLTYEVCRKLDPKAHVALGTYLNAYGPVGVFLMVTFATLLDVGGAVGLATNLEQDWPIKMIVAAPCVVLASLLLLFVTGNRGKTYKLVELMSVLSLLYQWYAVPIAAWAKWYTL
ncbi:hypothetical protein AB1Y20_008811 [Prymnesium parvum]|uniref:Pyruvate, water dikinase n=1 Tax=Prymnesium parvum TaxID=97485 RepID=A0AB34IRL0_PRYPA